ncbi:MAG: CDP-alcohol phosphatidyltransferase family protein [Ruminococcaceae bacterium]|nr:CDP-alcohol phosphatidyltransferase family protein [Oscillospiraceae bacterium]
MLKHVPNCITSLRIVGTACMLFTEPFSALFYIFYTFSGLTDVLDGFLARHFHLTSELGAKLDSVADLLFYAVMLFKILPRLLVILPRPIWTAVTAIILGRIISYTVAAIKYHRFASMHTYMNKLTGLGLFCVPYFLKLPAVNVACCIVACVIAGLATAEELLIHLTAKEYSAHRKSIFIKVPEQE